MFFNVNELEMPEIQTLLLYSCTKHIIQTYIKEELSMMRKLSLQEYHLEPDENL